ncbi:BrnA antitoxin family protein [Lamprobacter modestohalophilus]|uniref:BrnA antitoxin family protein n=1 Tax=Lamprobacter modestohalophilus TaxID=1064514 RepID=UPI002ADEEE43|nr:BrnA antitoxin family protein [Lamprobacter modestohalophilus]MEA1049701.1 BrnA antitoxin family protein [Lamprobacter modestohalophilus]
MKNAPTSITSKSGRAFLLNSEEEEARIREGIAADPDTHELTDEEMAELRPFTDMKRSPGRPKAEVTKERVTIRLSPEVTAYFRATGTGWQTRLDEVLRAYVDARR